MAGGVMRTAVERERAAAEDREAEARAEREELRVKIGGVSIRFAKPGIYVDVDGEGWKRHEAGKGASCIPRGGLIPHPSEWPEDTLDEVDATWGPFRWCGK